MATARRVFLAAVLTLAVFPLPPPTVVQVALASPGRTLEPAGSSAGVEARPSESPNQESGVSAGLSPVGLNPDQSGRARGPASRAPLDRQISQAADPTAPDRRLLNDPQPSVSRCCGCVPPTP